MQRQITKILLIFVLAPMAGGQTGVRKGPIVRQVDRILIESGDAKALTEFFVRELQLPEAWPLAENQGHLSAGLGAGNVTIEIYEYARPKKAAKQKVGTARFAGLALEPYPLEESLREMKAGGVQFDPPQKVFSTLPDGKQGVAWTIVSLPSLSKSGLSVFLHEYSQAFLKADVRRKQLGNRLTLNNGGPLGIQSVREVVLSAVQFRNESAVWWQLLGSRTPAGNWSVGAGPAIRVVSGSQNGIQKLVVQVRSLSRAREFLKKINLRGPESASELSINPSGVQGLRIGFVE